MEEPRDSSAMSEERHHPDKTGGDWVGVTRPEDESPDETEERFARSPDAAYGQREGQADESTQNEPDSTGGTPASS